MSSAYVPDPMELDEHVPVYVPEPEHPEYHAPSDDDIQVEDQPYADDASPTAESPGYIADSDSMEEDDDEDPEEDPSEKHEPEDDDDDDDTYDEDEEPTEEEEEEHLALADSSLVPVVNPVPSAGDTKAFETDESAPTPRLPQTRIPFSQTRLCHRAAMILESSAAAAARAPRGQYDFVDAVEARQGLTRSLGHDARTIARVADRAEDVGYVRALQASKRRMMTSMEEVNLRVSYQAQVCRQESEIFYTQLHDAQTDHRDIRLEINVVRGQKTAYEIELHEVRQAYLRSKAQNRALLAQLETLETHITRMEWQRQRAEDDANGHVRTLGHDAAYAITWGTFKKKLSDKYCPNGEIKKLEIELWNLKVKGNDVAAYTQRFQELALMYTKFLADETAKIDQPKTLDFAIELANDLMDQKLRTYAERQNENKRKADDSSRNNHQQTFPQGTIVDGGSYTAGTGEKKFILGTYPLCSKCQLPLNWLLVLPKCGQMQEVMALLSLIVQAYTYNNNNTNMISDGWSLL
ncbi:reverse transcriptase domain-containing protein [Tanacetum coccineum]